MSYAVKCLGGIGGGGGIFAPLFGERCLKKKFWSHVHKSVTIPVVDIWPLWVPKPSILVKGKLLFQDSTPGTVGKVFYWKWVASNVAMTQNTRGLQSEIGTGHDHDLLIISCGEMARGEGFIITGATLQIYHSVTSNRTAQKCSCIPFWFPSIH